MHFQNQTLGDEINLLITIRVSAFECSIDLENSGERFLSCRAQEIKDAGLRVKIGAKLSLRSTCHTSIEETFVRVLKSIMSRARY